MTRKRQRSDLHVYLQGQCSRIGDGWRGVQIVTLGRKWVRFRELSSCRACKVARQVWDRLVARAYETQTLAARNYEARK